MVFYVFIRDKDFKTTCSHLLIFIKILSQAQTDWRLQPNIVIRVSNIDQIKFMMKTLFISTLSSSTLGSEYNFRSSGFIIFSLSNQNFQQQKFRWYQIKRNADMPTQTKRKCNVVSGKFVLASKWFITCSAGT